MSAMMLACLICNAARWQTDVATDRIVRELVDVADCNTLLVPTAKKTDECGRLEVALALTTLKFGKCFSVWRGTGE